MNDDFHSCLPPKSLEHAREAARELSELATNMAGPKDDIDRLLLDAKLSSVHEAMRTAAREIMTKLEINLAKAREAGCDKDVAELEASKADLVHVLMSHAERSEEDGTAKER